MITLLQVVELLQDRNISHIAEKTGLTYQTVWRVKNGVPNVSYSTLKKLSDYFELHW